MNFLQILIAALGRMCLSAIFILSAIEKFMNWHETEQLVACQLQDFLILMHQQGWFYDFASTLLPWSNELLILVAAFEILGGILLFTGYYPRLGAVFLILFIIPTTVLFHHYWLLQGTERETQMIQFLKNLSILGGLFIVLAFGNSKAPNQTFKAPSK